MVTPNPLFHGRWTAKKFRATVLNDIWPEILFFSLVATMVYAVTNFTSANLAISDGLLTVLGVVLGVVISFRTSTAYERYQDGRKMWTDINIASRNLAQLIWIHVSADGRTNRTELQTIIEKKTMVNLVQAFSVAVKHLLRGEPGVYYQDLYPLICFLPRYANMTSDRPVTDDILPLWREVHASGNRAHGHPRSNTQDTILNPRSLHELSEAIDSKSSTSWDNTLSERNPSSKRKDTFDPEQALPVVVSEEPLKPARNPPETTLYDYIPLFRLFKWIFMMVLRRTASLAQMAQEEKKKGARDTLGRKKKGEEIESNVPLEICAYLSSYSAFVMKFELVTPAIATALTNNIYMLQDTMSNLDRIRMTPLPFAYQAHLRMSVWLYLFFLPFQLLGPFQYLVIPATAFASFLLIGFLEIGQEIENPFGYDPNDLDVDAFCLSIERELHEITTHLCPEPDVFIFSPQNQPFAPTDRRTAKDLIRDVTEYTPPHEGSEPGMASLRRILLKNWREIDRVTRDH